MGREDIERNLKDPKNGENNRKLLAFCKTPRTVPELGKAGVKGNVYNVLADLKRAGAVDFVDGKYVSTQLGLDTLNAL